VKIAANGTSDDCRSDKAERLGGLRRFAVAITVLNVLGHTVLGFEQSHLQPLVAVAAAYATELLLEAADALANRRRPAFAGGGGRVVDFLLSAHITGLAVAMLLYANDRLVVVAFAAAAAIASKALLRVPTGVARGTRHFFNPSNLGITITLLLFPWVGIAPPYQFTADVGPAAGWLLPAAIVCTGTFLNARFTKRLPLIAAWLVGFLSQALLRHLLFGSSLTAALTVVTGTAFILFTFYMVTDPATTPREWRQQIAFGAAVAAGYGLLMSLHVVFGLFFALSAVCALRGVSLYASALRQPQATPALPSRAPASPAGERVPVGHTPAIAGGGH
jgi:hypothetical protein